MKRKISEELLKKYLRNECTPEEEAIVDKWYGSFDHDKDDESFLAELESRGAEGKLFDRIRNKLGKPVFNDIPGKASAGLEKRDTFRRTFYLAAAITAVILVSGSVFYFSLFYKQVITAQMDLTQLSNESRMIKRVALEDGSVLWLHPRSKVEFPRTFLPDRREVMLTGEAFFLVSHDASRPFIIHSGNVVTRVLGTSFNIRAYEADDSIEVAVLTGKVSVTLAEHVRRDSHTPVISLIAHEQVRYFKERDVLKKEDVQKESPVLTMWKTSATSFNNVPVRDVLKSLNSSFHVTIEARNKDLLNCLIQADFTGLNLPDILEILSKSIEATYEIKGNTFYLTGTGCPE